MYTVYMVPRIKFRMVGHMKKNLLGSDSLMFDNRRIFALVIPLMAEQLLNAAIGFFDTLMVSSCGEAAVSGVALVDTISILVITVFTAISTGGTIVASQYLGRGEKDKANVAANQVFLSTLFISLLLALACCLLRKPLLLGIFGAIEDDVLSSALSYFLMLGISYPFVAQYNTCSAILRANGNSLTPMIVSVIMNLINVGGNALCIFGFNMGAMGAGLATLVSRVIGFIILFVLIRRPSFEVGLSTLFPIKPDFPIIKSVLAIGIPTGVENVIFHAGKLIVQRFVTSYGTMHIAANSIASTITNVPVILCCSFGLALTTIVGQCMGAGKTDQARYYTKRMLRDCWMLLIVLCTGMFFLRYPIASIYKLEGPTMELTADLLAISSIASLLFWTPSFIPTYTLRAAGDVKFVMLVGIISMWVCRVGLAYVFGTLLGLKSIGVLLGMCVDWLCRGVIFIIRFAGNKWTTRKVLS